MILFNKLIRTDLLLAICVVVVFLLHTGVLKYIFEGFVFATLLVSIFDHIEHYKQTRKLY